MNRAAADFFVQILGARLLAIIMTAVFARLKQKVIHAGGCDGHGPNSLFD